MMHRSGDAGEHGDVVGVNDDGGVVEHGHVPMDDDDIIKTVTNLPRTEKNSGMVIVGLKRDLTLKKFEKLEMISPDKVYNALLHLKENHSQYKDINISSLDQWYNQFDKNDTVSNNENSENEDTENVKGIEFRL